MLKYLHSLYKFVLNMYLFQVMKLIAVLMSMKINNDHCLTTGQKCEILQNLDKGEKAAKITLKNDIGKTTLFDIKKRPVIEIY